MGAMVGEYRDIGPCLRYWERHFRAKGCSPRKAEEMARRYYTRGKRRDLARAR